MLQFSQFPIKPQVLSGAHKPIFFINILLNANLAKKQFIALVLAVQSSLSSFSRRFASSVEYAPRL